MKSSTKNILLGLVIGSFLVFVMGATLTYHTNQNEYHDDSCTDYWGTGNDVSWTWDNSNGEFDFNVAGSYHFTSSAVADGKYGLEVQSAIAGGTASEGSAIYAHTSITGAIDAPTYNVGSWLDITSGTPTSSALFVALEGGVYVSASPTMTACDIAVLQLQYMGSSSSTCDIIAMIRVNSLLTGSGGEAPDYFIWAGNDESICFTSDSSTGATKMGAIKINSAQSGTMYIWTYDSTGS